MLPREVATGGLRGSLKASPCTVDVVSGVTALTRATRHKGPSLTPNGLASAHHVHPLPCKLSPGRHPRGLNQPPALRGKKLLFLTHSLTSGILLQQTTDQVCCAADPSCWQQWRT